MAEETREGTIHMSETEAGPLSKSLESLVGWDVAGEVYKAIDKTIDVELAEKKSPALTNKQEVLLAVSKKAYDAVRSKTVELIADQSLSPEEALGQALVSYGFMKETGEVNTDEIHRRVERHVQQIMRKDNMHRNKEGDSVVGSGQETVSKEEKKLINKFTNLVGRPLATAYLGIVDNVLSRKKYKGSKGEMKEWLINQTGKSIDEVLSRSTLPKTIRRKAVLEHLGFLKKGGNGIDKDNIHRQIERVADAFLEQKKKTRVKAPSEPASAPVFMTIGEGAIAPGSTTEGAPVPAEPVVEDISSTPAKKSTSLEENNETATDEFDTQEKELFTAADGRRFFVGQRVEYETSKGDKKEYTIKKLNKFGNIELNGFSSYVSKNRLPFLRPLEEAEEGIVDNDSQSRLKGKLPRVPVTHRKTKEELRRAQWKSAKERKEKHLDAAEAERIAAALDEDDEESDDVIVDEREIAEDEHAAWEKRDKQIERWKGALEEFDEASRETNAEEEPTGEIEPPIVPEPPRETPPELPPEPEPETPEVDTELVERNKRIEELKKQLDDARAALVVAEVARDKQRGFWKKLFGGKNEEAEARYNAAWEHYQQVQKELQEVTAEQAAELCRSLTEEEKQLKKDIAKERGDTKTTLEAVGDKVRDGWNKLGRMNLLTYLEQKGSDDKSWIGKKWNWYKEKTTKLQIPTLAKLVPAIIGVRPMIGLGLAGAGLMGGGLGAAAIGLRVTSTGVGTAIGARAGMDAIHRSMLGKKAEVFATEKEAQDYVREQHKLAEELNPKEMKLLHKLTADKTLLEQLGKTSGEKLEALDHKIEVYEAYAVINGTDLENDELYKRLVGIRDTVGADWALEAIAVERDEVSVTEKNKKIVDMYLERQRASLDQVMKHTDKERRIKWGKQLSSVMLGILGGGLLYKYLATKQTLNSEGWATARADAEWREEHGIPGEVTGKRVASAEGIVATGRSSELLERLKKESQIAPLPVEEPEVVPVEVVVEKPIDILAAAEIKKDQGVLHGLDRLFKIKTEVNLELDPGEHVAWEEFKKMSSAEQHKWKMDQLEEMGFKWVNGRIAYPFTVHEGATLKLYQGVDGQFHARFDKDIGKVTLHDNLFVKEDGKVLPVKITAEMQRVELNVRAFVKEVGADTTTLRSLSLDEGVMKQFEAKGVSMEHVRTVDVTSGHRARLSFSNGVVVDVMPQQTNGAWVLRLDTDSPFYHSKALSAAKELGVGTKRVFTDIPRTVDPYLPKTETIVKPAEAHLPSKGTVPVAVEEVSEKKVEAAVEEPEIELTPETEYLPEVVEWKKKFDGIIMDESGKIAKKVLLERLQSLSVRGVPLDNPSIIYEELKANISSEEVVLLAPRPDTRMIIEPNAFRYIENGKEYFYVHNDNDVYFESRKGSPVVVNKETGAVQTLIGVRVTLNGKLELVIGE